MREAEGIEKNIHFSRIAIFDLAKRMLCVAKHAVGGQLQRSDERNSRQVAASAVSRKSGAMFMRSLLNER